MQRAGEAPSLFRVGEQIPETGVYRVFHDGHRVSHEVLLLTGEKFPRCVKCNNDVQFELLRTVPAASQDHDFIRLYEIPHPDAENSQETQASA